MPEPKSPSLAREIFHYLRENMRWWLTPIILVLLFMVIVALFFGQAPALPFIYTIF